jgi:hypothetical protein
MSHKKLLSEFNKALVAHRRDDIAKGGRDQDRRREISNSSLLKKIAETPEADEEHPQDRTRMRVNP